MPTLREFCVATATTITSQLLGINMPAVADGEFEKLITDLEEEFKASYESKGKPYGDSEEEMVQYFLDNVTFTVQDNVSIEIRD